MTVVPFAGAVLTGGASRRMGSDKALLSVGGRPMAVVAADALRAAGAVSVTAVGGDAIGLRSVGLDWVTDSSPGEGPLGGLLAAMEALDSAPVVVVLACDLPSASSANVIAVVDAVADLLGTPAAAVPVIDLPRGGRQREWLHAAWTTEARDVLRVAWAAGERAPRRAVAGLQVVEVSVPEPDALADADHPTDLPGQSGSDGPDR
ncbi:MAG: molybdenum cofactor guanylyltransferase [Actinomycetota bacterium]|nr:molybdenum cofactor guanylyltransferase [Actinomycetota bacterium]MEC9425576.1 molybdenum cofactor guanylyltransferase [Actinomycetota bacterium]MED6328133.1 molybdenum cofactor guanylyltransferase [Actinomycetota bacterium]